MIVINMYKEAVDISDSTVGLSLPPIQPGEKVTVPDVFEASSSFISAYNNKYIKIIGIPHPIGLFLTSQRFDVESSAVVNNAKYVLKAGVSGGQTAYGGTGAGDTLSLSGSNVDSGGVILDKATVSELVGTGDRPVIVDSTGKLKTSGITRTIVLSGAGGWPSTTNGCSVNTKVNFPSNGVDAYTLDFSSAIVEYAQWTLAMPATWDGGTVSAKFYWVANDTTTNSVVWGLQGRSYSNGELIDQTWGTAKEIIDANDSIAYQLRISDVTDVITLAGTPAGGELVQFRAYRNAIDIADTLAVDARLILIMLTYTDVGP
ncbi:MAG: hypothetical protein AABY32_02235 [Nanoarchaeota archaeon]